MSNESEWKMVASYSGSWWAEPGYEARKMMKIFYLLLAHKNNKERHYPVPRPSNSSLNTSTAIDKS